MKSETETLCLGCQHCPVTWPLFCEHCIDQEAQAYLALSYGEEVESFRCRNCGMIYDGGMRCTYCGDHDPTGVGVE